MSDTIKHGSYYGYKQHKELRVPVCDACRQAVNDYNRDHRLRRQLAATGEITVSLDVLGALLIAAPTELEELVEAALGSTVVEVAIAAAVAEPGELAAAS